MRALATAGSVKAFVATAIVLLFALSAHGQSIQSPASPSADWVMFAQSIKEVATVPGAALVRSELTQAELGATLDFSVALKMRDFTELQKRVASGEIISVDELATKYYPTTADYNKVVQWLGAQGFAIKPADKYNLSLFARGTVAQIERAFGTKFGLVNFAGVESISALSAPSFPAAVAAPVLSINGLQPYLHPRPHFIRVAPSHKLQKRGIVYLNGGQWQFGGTSCCAPTWAGFCAMINQARISLGKPSVGLLGPKIYPLIGTSNFRDITTGSN